MKFAMERNTKDSRTGVWKKLRHKTCVDRVHKVCEHNSYVKFMLEAMKNAGCEVSVDEHIVCEPCDSNTRLSGGFDPEAKQIIICENKSTSERVVSRLLTHELIHAYDHCRIDIDWTNLSHVACSEIRAANLSGECSFISENLYGRSFGIKKHHQDCVRRHATESMMCARSITKEKTEGQIDRVWSRCFNDFAPFPRIPRGPSDLKDLPDRTELNQTTS
ncbi:Mitochondrial inner membrane protease ATP23-like [Holothuria leucospilota]|uniref:Mitochondrial inner membrane protease ATP23 n=1 Tax=Holothuria leucospilota TaxID=206669 RepID=A0A9Q1CKT7_HOLLE|nr:Mitochondrial inner membrane protease ATP23-like [Holothuria leucospilota]